MHVPQYHKKPGWQRFLVGIFFGALISYWVVLFMYGDMYESLLKEYSKVENKLHDAEKRISVLEEDNEDLNKKSNQKITIEEIDLEILNAKDLKIDILLQDQLERLVKEELEDIIGIDIQTIAASDSLIVSSIENKNFKVDDFTYSFEIKRLVIATTVKIVVHANLSDSV
ncbi:sporulation membrane protein YtrI [Ornithinibacillus californiensis]|uniref:sporulation membrane protein YtrI n=1 Tax=Ornithinibacillus californiensis TaxID=161536 RepID=UPI00064D944A|nr:sporulation membrane protein YtrI [Ornithinibacillus californiensis]